MSEPGHLYTAFKHSGRYKAAMERLRRAPSGLFSLEDVAFLQVHMGHHMRGYRLDASIELCERLERLADSVGH